MKKSRMTLNDLGVNQYTIHDFIDIDMSMSGLAIVVLSFNNAKHVGKNYPPKYK